MGYFVTFVTRNISRGLLYAKKNVYGKFRVLKGLESIKCSSRNCVIRFHAMRKKMKARRSKFELKWKEQTNFGAFKFQNKNSPQLIQNERQLKNQRIKDHENYCKVQIEQIEELKK